MHKTSNPRRLSPASAARSHSDPQSGRLRPPLPLLEANAAAVTGDTPSPVAVCSAGGALHFELSAAPSGVHVVRTHRRTDGSKVHCSVLFDDLDGFTDWLDADPMRFTHPLAFQQARRCFQQLLVRGNTDEPAVR